MAAMMTCNHLHTAIQSQPLKSTAELGYILFTALAKVGNSSGEPHELTIRVSR